MKNIKNKLIWGIAIVFVIFVIGDNILYQCHPNYADFLMKSAVAFGTLTAVLYALFGTYLKETIDPIQLRIEVPEEGNTVIERVTFGQGQAVDAYFHHLVVRNLTPYQPIKECRVWLKRILIQQVNGEWKDEFKFAVPRLMNWAPSEFSPDKRTFSTKQVFDVGMTLANNGGFKASINSIQRGNVKSEYPINKNLRFVFFVTADNYLKEKEFVVEIQVLPSRVGDIVTPSKVSLLK